MTNTVATAIPAHAIGDLVRLIPSARGKYDDSIFRVVDVPGGRRTKLKVISVRGGITLAGAPELFESVPASEASRVSTASVPELVLGSLVRINGHDANTYVVIKLSVGAANLALLGGDGNRFLRSVPLQRLTAVEFAATPRFVSA